MREQQAIHFPIRALISCTHHERTQSNIIIIPEKRIVRKEMAPRTPWIITLAGLKCVISASQSVSVIHILYSTMQVAVNLEAPQG